jgi:putative transposase
VQKLYPFHLFGFVIMPDHCHFLVVVPYPGKISDIMRTFKMGLTFQIGKGPLWQTRFHIELVKNSRAALKYIHQNPVKEGLVKDERDFPWSSAAGNWPIYPLGYS